VSTRPPARRVEECGQTIGSSSSVLQPRRRRPGAAGGLPMSSLARVLKLAALSTVGAYTAWLGLIYAAQDRLIYLRPRYSGAPWHYDPIKRRPDVRSLSFGTADGRQLGYWVEAPPPPSPGRPSSSGGDAPVVAMLFGANAQTALDWLPFVDSLLRASAKSDDATPLLGALLVDYPGMYLRNPTVAPSS
jgi:hypothetical protein